MKPTYYADFETSTIGDATRVWLSGWIDEDDNYMWWNDIDGFMHSFTCACDVYFHNLKYDGSYILNYLLSNGFSWVSDKPKNNKEFSTCIDDMGTFYSIEVKYRKFKVTFKDSYKLLPFSEEVIAISFGLDTLKGSIDYTKPRPFGYEPTYEELAYHKNDIIIMKKGLWYFFSQQLTKMTIASNAFNYFKASLGSLYKAYFPVFDVELDNEFRKYYKGGFVYCVEDYKDKILSDISCYDVNSLYPYVMYTFEYPIGNPKKFAGKYKGSKTCVLHHIKSCFVLKEGYLPTIQLKNTRGFIPTEYLKHSDGLELDLYLPQKDLELFLEHYDIITLEYVDGWEFKSVKGLFQQYIDHWIQVKKDNEGGLRQLAKLMLNSLYGKFATKAIRKSKKPYLDEDGVLRFITLPPEVNEPIYTPISVFVTSYARYYTITNAQMFYKEKQLVYCDTDSIHCIGENIHDLQVDDKELGKWKKEYVFDKARYLHAKCYYGEKINDYGKLDKKIKVAGLPKSKELKDAININNFTYNFSYGKVLKSKQVKGGVALVEKEFTIK